MLENWHRMVGRSQPDGVLVEGTCKEVGGVASGVHITAAGPHSPAVSPRLADLDAPSVVAE